MSIYEKMVSISLLLFTILVNGFVFSEQVETDNNSASATTGTTAICRFSVNGSSAPDYDTDALRIGWYIDYGARSNATKPNGAEYAPMIRLQQDGADNYTYTPSGSLLLEAIAGNPGAVWLIGNEPDRRDYQDDLEPHVYAKAYHDLYALIKNEDSSAQIFAGNIVQPTPLRLQYLDMILDSYQITYGIAMPVDGWSIHNFILNEGCDEWGADIPPGIDSCEGVTVAVDDTDNMAVFQQRIVDFRVWMKNNGYKEKPLYITEYGILMPQDFGYPSTRVNAFMNNSFDYMMTAEDAVLGYSADNNHLVQKWSWYSVDDKPNFNGWLFDPVTKALSDMGVNYQQYTDVLDNDVDVLPTTLTTDPSVPYTNGNLITITLEAVIANIGYLPQDTEPLAVRFYDGDPEDGGVPIGVEQSIIIGGCSSTQVSVVWADVASGVHRIYVVVDAATGESVVDNNVATYAILVATERTFLPLVQK